MSARETAELLLQVGRLVQAESYDGELSPAQWMALRYFARANSFSRNPSAFAEFQATTRGTASQAIKALEADGYLVRQQSDGVPDVPRRRFGLSINADRVFGTHRGLTGDFRQRRSAKIRLVKESAN